MSNGLRRAGLIVFAIVTLVACSNDKEAAERSHPDDWRAELPIIKFGSSASEEDPIALRRVELVSGFLSNATGVPVKVYQTSDYNGNVQAISSGQTQMGTMGAGTYANVYSQIGDLAEPILVRRDAFGQAGYYSTLIVRADSPYQSIEDLEGKTLAYVDFNSTSGYIFPRWRMRDEGINPETFFAAAAMAGKHTQAVLALLNGQFDATIVNASGGTPELGFASGTIKRLARRGLVEENEFRTIWYAGPIPTSPYVVRTDMPQEARDLVRGAIAAMPYDSPEAFLSMGRLPGTNYLPVDHSFFEEIIEMREKEIANHRQLAINGRR